MPSINSQLMKAIRADDGVLVAEAVRSGADPNACNKIGLTPFIWCARKGHITAARALLSAGADPEARDSEHRTAIHHATLFKRRAFIDYLISIGANLAATERYECSALDLALYNSDPKTVAQLTAAKVPAPKHPKHYESTPDA